jgi:hypothetical protein
MSIPRQLRLYVFFIAILWLAFAMRLWDLNARSLWFDEATEYWDARNFEIAAVETMSSRQDPPLYSFMLRGWMSLGEDAFTLRFPSVCFSVLTVAGIMLLAYRSFGLGISLLSGLIVSALPTEIEYAQQAEQYAPLVCLITFSLVGIEQIVRTRKWSIYALWILAAAAGTYIHYGAVVGILPPMGYLIISDVWRRDFRSVIKNCLSLLAYGVAIVPLAVFLLPGQLQKGPTRNAFQISFGAPIAELETFWTATQHMISFVLTGWPWSDVPEWIPAVLLVVPLLSAIVYVARRPSQERVRMLGMLVTTWAIYYGMSKFNLYPYGFRYALILTPLLAVIIACGIANLLAHKISLVVGIALMIGLCGSMIVSLPNRTLRETATASTIWLWPETSDIGQLAQYWLTNRAAGESTYVYYGAVPGFRYYLDVNQQEARSLPPNWYARCWLQTVEFCVENGVFYGTWLRAQSPTEKLVAIHQTIGTMPQRLWLIFDSVSPDEDNVILNQLAAQYQTLQVYRIRWDSAYLLEQR